ncbi:hypothetical protein GCM10020367_15990 [Streptomyces sannanensis]|uniref:Uncharacterized protein n=1 Tax=Streptomyces sannanensis TaxID=285536 RepID=A0ABP6S7N5_9ACTN
MLPEDFMPEDVTHLPGLQQMTEPQSQYGPMLEHCAADRAAGPEDVVPDGRRRGLTRTPPPAFRGQLTGPARPIRMSNQERPPVRCAE